MKKKIFVYVVFLAFVTFVSTPDIHGAPDDPDNTVYGYQAGNSITTGLYNAFFGVQAGNSTTGAEGNTFIGYAAGFSNETGLYNTFLGENSGYNSLGDENTFIGDEAGYKNNSGNYNTFVGASAGWNNTVGVENTFIGDYAGFNNTNGGKNTFIGNEAGYFNSGSFNIFIGNQAGRNEPGSNRLYIDNTNTAFPLVYGEFDNNILIVNGNLGVGTTGFPATALEVNGTVTATAFAGDGSGLTNIPANAHTHTGADIVSGTVAETYIDASIARDTEVTTQVDAHAARTDNPHSVSAALIGAASSSHNHDARYVNVSGDTITGDLLVTGIVDVDSDLYVVGNMYLESDMTAKRDIRPIESSLEKIKNINGVSFAWKDEEKRDNRNSHAKHYGVIAQDVEEVLPDLVRKGKNGLKKVAYFELIPVLIEAVKEQQKTISGLLVQVNTLERTLETERTIALAETTEH